MIKSDRFNKPPRKNLRSQLSNLTPKPLEVNVKSMVHLSTFNTDKGFPGVLRPVVADFNLGVWLHENRSFIDELLLEYGALLFRGFDIFEPNELEAVVKGVTLKPAVYMEGATPRTRLGGRLFTSTNFPNDQSIAVHNELSYVNTWPMRLIFWCHTPPERGGATPICDVHEVYKILSPRIVEMFERHGGWMLVRNYGSGFGPSWQTSFHLESVEELEEYCRTNQIQTTWIGKDHLRTVAVRPVIAHHPLRKVPLWFNHVAFWHDSCLNDDLRQLMIDDFGYEDLPYKTLFGDGTPIPAEIIGEIVAAYDKATTFFPYERGDVLLVDNMLVAHGRQPYEGERKIVVSMGDPCSQRFLPKSEV